MRFQHFLLFLVSPRFQRRPTSLTTDVRSDVEFACDVYGNPPPLVTWLKNGEAIISSNYFQVSDGGRRLNILGLVPRDAGMYQCTAENEVGSIQASASLTIRQATGACYVIITVFSRVRALPCYYTVIFRASALCKSLLIWSKDTSFYRERLLGYLWY